MADGKTGDQFEEHRASGDRRSAQDPAFPGPERRSGKDRRKTPRA